MEDIRFTKSNDMKDFLNGGNVKFLGSGSEGSCYKIGNKTYKLYDERYIGSLDNQISINELLQFRDLLVDNVYFIRALIYCEGKVIGSVCDYASGKVCAKIDFCKRNLDSLIVALNILKKNIYELSELGICIEDEFLYNILYDGNSFKLIDTGFYYFSKDVDIFVIYKKNMTKIVGLLLEEITRRGEIEDKFVYSYLSDINSPYKRYIFDSYWLMNPDEAIKGIRNKIQEDIGREIVSFSNCREDLLKIRKKYNTYKF